MKIKRSELVLTFLVGFAACEVSGGTPNVLLILMTFLAVGAFVFDYFGIVLKLPRLQLGSFRTNSETKSIEREAFVPGIGHQLRR